MNLFVFGLGFTGRHFAARARARFETVRATVTDPAAADRIAAETSFAMRAFGPEADDPRIASITPEYPGAGFPEREVYDLLGIVFDGHPDLTRILMPDDWEGHPLRKDDVDARIPVTFKADPGPR